MTHSDKKLWSIVIVFFVFFFLQVSIARAETVINQSSSTNSQAVNAGAYIRYLNVTGTIEEVSLYVGKYYAGDPCYIRVCVATSEYYPEWLIAQEYRQEGK